MNSNTDTVKVSQLGGLQAWINWLLGTAFVVVVFTLQTGYAITNVAISKSLVLSVSQVGLIGSIYTWAFAIAQFGSGSIMDKLGARWVLPFAAILTTIGAFLMANATGAGMLVAAQVFMALGGAFGFVGAGFVGGQWFAPIKYGFMFSLVQFVASMAAIGGQKSIAALLNTNSWDTIINGMAVASLVLTVLMFIVLRDPVKAGRENVKWEGLVHFFDELFKALGQVMSVRHTWINALIGGATFGTMLALGVVWGPRFLIAGGMDEGAAFGVSSMMWLGLAIGAPLFSKFSDTVKKRKMPMALGCALQLVAIVIILMRPGMSPTEASVWFFLWGFMAGGSMLNFPIGAELVSPSLVGTSAAVVNAVQFIVGGLMMAIPGRVLSGAGMIARFRESTVDYEVGLTGTVQDYQWALVVLPISLGLALILFLFLKETFPEQSQ